MSIHDITEKDAAYGYFMDPRNPALDLACEVAIPPEPDYSRNTWRRRLEVIGEERFRLEMYYFWNDLRHRNSIANLPAALTARLNHIMEGMQL